MASPVSQSVYKIYICMLTGDLYSQADVRLPSCFARNPIAARVDASLPAQYTANSGGKSFTISLIRYEEHIAERTNMVHDNSFYKPGEHDAIIPLRGETVEYPYDATMARPLLYIPYGGMADIYFYGRHFPGGTAPGNKEMIHGIPWPTMALHLFDAAVKVHKKAWLNESELVAMVAYMLRDMESIVHIVLGGVNLEHPLHIENETTRHAMRRKRFWAIPVNVDSNHWIAAIYDQGTGLLFASCSLQRGKTLKDQRSRVVGMVAGPLRKWIFDSSDLITFVEDIAIEAIRSPKQHGDWECGFFVAENIRRFFHEGQANTFTFDIPHFTESMVYRRHLFTTTNATEKQIAGSIPDMWRLWIYDALQLDTHLNDFMDPMLLLYKELDENDQGFITNNQHLVTTAPPGPVSPEATILERRRSIASAQRKHVSDVRLPDARAHYSPKVDPKDCAVSTPPGQTDMEELVQRMSGLRSGQQSRATTPTADSPQVFLKDLATAGGDHSRVPEDRVRAAEDAYTDFTRGPLFRHTSATHLSPDHTEDFYGWKAGDHRPTMAVIQEEGRKGSSNDRAARAANRAMKKD
ncbi:hypothetical protein OQA88_13702 [Cercophora sp. LCS_1]